MTEISKVQTKGTLTENGDPMSRQMIITIEGIESMKEEKAILKGLKSLLLEVSGRLKSLLLEVSGQSELT